MEQFESSKPGIKQALKSLGFGGFLFFAGIRTEEEIQLGETDFSHFMSSFLILFGAYVLYTGVKELIQTLK